MSEEQRVVIRCTGEHAGLNYKYKVRGGDYVVHLAGRRTVYTGIRKSHVLDKVVLSYIDGKSGDEIRNYVPLDTQVKLVPWEMHEMDLIMNGNPDTKCTFDGLSDFLGNKNEKQT